MPQSFAATVVVAKMLRPGWFHLELELDEAVDVVTFDSFSNFRQRVRGIVGPQGTSREKLTGGQSHLALEL